ncbi:unnamed protein product, partial [Didymodactylos carnosus]
MNCSDNGWKYTFSELLKLGIEPSTLLTWGISIEQANSYAVCINKSSENDSKNQFICNCTNSSIFGKYCEYQFYTGTSFKETIFQQFNHKEKHPSESQYQEKRTCYTSFECDSGLMCLDWRQVCDGIQDCMRGVDEENCHKLEFNECDENEYRCSNGMCIPEEYFLDGEPDCMDGTDEKFSNRRNNVVPGHFLYCPYHPNVYCDERSCLKYQYSCGDGQCLKDEWNRLQSTFYSNVTGTCYMYRNMNYICGELGHLWSNDGGFCRIFRKENRLNMTTKDQQCQYLVTCALGKGMPGGCPCGVGYRERNCSDRIIQTCTQTIMYPQQKVFQPFIFRIYLRDRDWSSENKKADYLFLNGSIKCYGYEIYTTGVTVALTADNRMNPLFAESIFCKLSNNTIRNYSSNASKYDLYCWNNSKTYSNNLPYPVSHDFTCKDQCFSKYRVRDGNRDCFSSSEEGSSILGSCSSIQRYRFQCSHQEHSCLIIDKIGDDIQQCSNNYDENLWGGNTKLLFEACHDRYDYSCMRLRSYVEMSSKPTKTAENTGIPFLRLPFRQYCNSFLDSVTKDDELSVLCQDWSCWKNWFRCTTGQCILREWVCDGEWDCNDGSDEQKIFTIKEFDDHNSEVWNLTQAKKKCNGQYPIKGKHPFSNWCNVQTEYPCLLANVSDPLDFILNRPCISLENIGDGHADCIGHQDEKNIQQCNKDDNHTIGANYYCSTKQNCVMQDNLCATTNQCPNSGIDSVCFYKQKEEHSSECNGANDFRCYGGECKRNARCNYGTDCPDGEDEYWCYVNRDLLDSYRRRKRDGLRPSVRLPSYPVDGTGKSNVTSVSTKIIDSNLLIENRVERGKPVDLKNLSFVCQRGVAIEKNSETICLCPPSYAGENCEFSADRLTIITHLNLTGTTYYGMSSTQYITAKVLTTFWYADRLIVDHHIFHVIPQMETAESYVKRKFYLLYPRTLEFIREKRFNRNNTQNYTVQFEAYIVRNDSSITVVGIWNYPIYFDFLPSYRLSKILRFPTNQYPCFSNLCGAHGTCHRFLNDLNSYYCYCDSGYYGKLCGLYDNRSTICSSHSIARPYHRGIVHGEDTGPLCLCLLNYYGSTCHLFVDPCLHHQCENGATCYPAYEPNDIAAYQCACSHLFYGDRCQYLRPHAQVDFVENIENINEPLVTSVFYCDLGLSKDDIIIVRQEVYSSQPAELDYLHDDKYLPALGILKSYDENFFSEHRPTYYLLYSQEDTVTLNINISLTAKTRCPHTKEMLDVIFQ